ncbi:MAG: lysoplasmalogenase, partial [Hyphomonadaceae bacterium]
VLGPNKRDRPVAGFVVLVSLAMLGWMVPGMGDLLIPALIYQAIITTMVATAMVVKAPMLARLGAVVFMLSDTLIAIGKFTTTDVLPGSVWITYAGAQIMIAWGLSRIAPYRARAKLSQPATA